IEASLRRTRQPAKRPKSPQPKRCGLIEATRPSTTGSGVRYLRSRKAAASLKHCVSTPGRIRAVQSRPAAAGRTTMKYYSGFPSRAERAMPDCLATVSWQRNGGLFADNRYSRAHEWRFDGGAVVRASSSPHIVRVPMSDPAAVDPEEAFVASL